MAARQVLRGPLIVLELLRGLQSGKMVKWIVHLVLLLSVPDDVWRTVYTSLCRLFALPWLSPSSTWLMRTQIGFTKAWL